MKFQRLKNSKMAKAVVMLSFLVLSLIGSVPAQSGAAPNAASVSEADIRMNALASRRSALGTVSSNLLTAVKNTPDGSWEQGKLIADAKREYEIALAEIDAVERMNLILTVEQKAKIADHRRDYALIIRSFDGMIARSNYQEDSRRASVQGSLPLSEKYGIYLAPLTPLRTEIDTLDQEIRKNTTTPARSKEIFARIEQNSTKILAGSNDVLILIEREPDSTEKNTLKKHLTENVAIMNANLEAVRGNRYLALIEGRETAARVAPINKPAPNSGPPSALPPADQVTRYMAAVKKRVAEAGQRIVAEGDADKVRPFTMSSSGRLPIEASSNLHFVLFVISDDPTYDTFFYLNGQFMNTPVRTGAFYVTETLVTKLSETYNLYAFTMGFNNENRRVEAEFRGDRPGKVRYLLVQFPKDK